MSRWIEQLKRLFASATPMAICGACGALAVMLFLPQPTATGAQDAPAVSHVRQAEPQADQNRLGAGELAQLRADNARLESQLLALQQQLQSLTAASPVEQQSGAQRQTHGAEQELGDVATAGVSADEQFVLLEEQFYAAPVDAHWSAAMQRDLHLIEARLEASTAGNTFIEHQECRSNACRLEIVHEAQMPALLPALIASPQNRRVTLRTVDEEGQLRTIALYQK